MPSSPGAESRGAASATPTSTSKSIRSRCWTGSRAPSRWPSTARNAAVHASWTPRLTLLLRFWPGRRSATTLCTSPGSTSTAVNQCPPRIRNLGTRSSPSPPTRRRRTSLGSIFRLGSFDAAAASKWKYPANPPRPITRAAGGGLGAGGWGIASAATARRPAGPPGSGRRRDAACRGRRCCSSAPRGRRPRSGGRRAAGRTARSGRPRRWPSCRPCWAG